LAENAKLGESADVRPASHGVISSVRKGGGAIRGIGEKFATNPATGTASMSVPLATSPSRSGFSPELSLSYDSGSGNGPFGFGWTLSVPAIARKTDKGLPRYTESGDPDVFVLSGAEDLVPLFKRSQAGGIVRDPQGEPLFDEREDDGHVVRRYRPRVEGPFVRVERWTRQSDADVHWRSISRDNVLSLYGKDANSRVVDPTDDRRIFTWLLCETRDDRGNAVVYEYKPEDGAGVDLGRAHQRTRGAGSDARRAANRYLKHIRYGNRVPLLDGNGQRLRALTAAQVARAMWMFEVVFDYGEHDADAPRPGDSGEWAYRRDPFSVYLAGFEVRTTRLCRRVLMFHHFADEPAVGSDCLVGSTSLTYSGDGTYSFLRTVTRSGHRRHGTQYLTRSMPALEFEYTQPVVGDTVRDVDTESLANLPVGVDGSAYQWLDVHGEGIAGILTEQAGAWFYTRNLSPASDRSVEFAPAEPLATKPNLVLADGQLMDLAGDGRLDAVALGEATPGLYEHDDQNSWEPFRALSSRLHRDMRDPNLRFVDLDGDGRPDVLIDEHESFHWHASLGEDGFGPGQRMARPDGEAAGPQLVFADFSGDGLADLARIRNGEVCYWPNLGYGRFGPQITMDGAPLFDDPDQFDQRRILLADIDGTGTTDVVYLHRDGVRVYFNECGNGWSAPHRLRTSPPVDDVVSITATDLLGNGTACLVWSSPLPDDAGRQMRFVELMGGRKPHLLVKVVNNLGTETEVQYTPSTTFYLRDKRAGRPWITRLPFPVHVVERIETRDLVSGNRFVTRYAYHHGHFDADEREFRGFGMVEQWDSEDFTPEADADTTADVPPVLSRSWFHTGAFVEGPRISKHFEHEYYREPLSDDDLHTILLPDTVLPDDLPPDELAEACRSLRGSLLREEIYTLDRRPDGALTEQSSRPHLVAERNYTVTRLQARERNRHAVFFAHPREAIELSYERRLVDVAGTKRADPRVGHTLTLAVDEGGNVTRSVAIAYRRRPVPALQAPEQADTHWTLMVNRFANRVDEPDWHRVGLPVEARTFEVVKPPEPATARGLVSLFSFDAVRELVAQLFPLGLLAPPAASTWPYERWDWRRNPANAPASTRLRVIEHVRTRYRDNDLSALLPLGQVHSLALPGESYALSLTPALLDSVFKRKRTGQPDEALLPAPGAMLESTGADRGGYVLIDGNWWVPSGRVFYDPSADPSDPAATAVQELAEARRHFYLPRKRTDAFGHSTLTDYDGPTAPAAPRYDLLVTATTDPVLNTVRVVNDYRVLRPRLVVDPNRNRRAIAFDALGMVVATAVMGKDGQAAGDLLEDVEPDPSLGALQAFVADPDGQAASLLGKATTRIVYDIGRFRRFGGPVVAATLERETHFHSPGGAQTKIQIAFSYSDGFGREIQQKTSAEAGDAPQRAAPSAVPGGDVMPGELVRDAAGGLVQAHALHRWVGSGRTVFNNKGKPVRQYEPFVSATHLYEPERDMTDTGVSSVIFYDPLERVVAMLHPDHTYEKVVFDPWTRTMYDPNDVVAARANQTGDARSDPDVAGYVRDWFQAQPATWSTWYAERIGRPVGDPQRGAAEKAATHADTPTVLHLDPLGRPFLTVAHNRFVRGGAVVEEAGATRVERDLEGNQRAVRDAKGRLALACEYDMLGTRLHQASIDAGRRWLVPDAGGRPIRRWDSRGFLQRMSYDELRRPTHLHVTEDGAERLAERTDYGEGEGDAKNHRTRPYQVRDGAGIVTSVEYDFEGNLIESRRDLLAAPAHRQAVNWQANPAASGGSFTTLTTYDALGRELAATTPDGTVYRPAFNKANRLDAVAVNLRGAAPATPVVTNIDYDAHGRRERIVYGNGASTAYGYDPLTFRLTRVTTSRPPSPDPMAASLFGDPTVIQDLRFTYDAAANIIRLEDAALGAVWDYTYDAWYRLVTAAGPEHVDLQAVRNVTEHFEYDIVGNFEVVRHDAAGAAWVRHYAYEEASPLEPGEHSNRLSRTMLENGVSRLEVYAYDDHGNTRTMPHLPSLAWDFKDQLERTDLGAGRTAYCVYDATGRRVRRVVESQNAAPEHERIYLGAFEIGRDYGAGAVQEHETVHVIDDVQRIALVETDPSQGVPELRYQLANHLGSACLELDAAGEVMSYEEYAPYGSSSYQARRDQTNKRYGFTGKELDDPTGLYYFGARYYAPWLGRWTSCDPVPPRSGQEGVDLYTYCRGNPIGAVDPDGRDIVVLKESRLSARQFVDLIKQQKDLPAGIRNAISVNPKDPSKIRFSGANRTYSSQAEADKWDPLYKELQRAAASDRFALTTGTVSRAPGESAVSQLFADIRPGVLGMAGGPEGFVELRSRTLNLPMAGKDVIGIVVPSMREAASLNAEGRAYAGSRIVTDQLPDKRSLVVVGTALSSGDATAAIDARTVVNTLFHELALHASGIAGEDVDIRHGSPRVDALETDLNRLFPDVGMPDLPSPAADAGAPAATPVDAGLPALLRRPDGGEAVKPAPR
jgi:RHS repeat-associated protein